MMKRILRGEQGVGMVLVLALMALAIPILTAALGLASTLSIDSRVKTDIAKGQYTDLGVPEIVEELILNDPDFVDGLDDDIDGDGEPDGDEIIVEINDEETTITVTPDDPGVSDPGAGEGLRVTKLVNPTTAPELSPTPTEFTYTITVENTTGAPLRVGRIHDGLPAGFTYLGPTSGITSDDPEEEWLDNQDDIPTYLHLTWELPGSGVEVGAGQSISLAFVAQASDLAEGHYCNEAWIDPDGSQTRTGKTARVTVGAPDDDACVGEDVDIDSSVEVEPSPDDPDMVRVTYTIEITNTGDETLHIWWIRDKLPPDFTYVLGSTRGDITDRNPFPRLVLWGQQRLNWFFVFSLPEILPGETKTLIFEADAPLSAGNYYNEVWVFFVELEDNEAGYSYPSALVTMMDVYEVSIDGETEPSSEIWVLDDESYIFRWDIGR